MENALTITLVPCAYSEKLKWGFFQTVRIFIQNRLPNAVFIRKFDIEGQLPDCIPWYGDDIGEVGMGNNFYLHHLLADMRTSPVLARGLILPGQRLIVSMGMRMHANEQVFNIDFQSVPIQALRHQVFFRSAANYTAIETYHLPTKSREKEYSRESLLPEQLKLRTVIAPELDKFPLLKCRITAFLELGNRKAKGRIEKLMESASPVFYYYFAPLNEWFAQRDNKQFLIRKEQGKLHPVELPSLDLRILDAMENNPLHEATFVITPQYQARFQALGIDNQREFTFVRAENLMDIIELIEDGAKMTMVQETKFPGTSVSYSLQSLQ